MCFYIFMFLKTSLQTPSQFFGSGGKQFLVLRTYLVYNTSFCKTLFYFISLSQPLLMDRITDGEMNTLAACGLEEFFFSCAVVSVFGSGGKQVLVLHTCVLRVQYSCGIVLVFLVLVGNSFWCYVRTQCTIQLCSCVSYLVVVGHSSQNENTF